MNLKRIEIRDIHLLPESKVVSTRNKTEHAVQSNAAGNEVCHY